MAKKTAPKTRRILVILSDRLNRLRKPHYVEVLCKPNGTILKETVLKRPPARRAYDEVWKNEDGKRSLDRCMRMSRIYRHPLEKIKTTA